VIGYFRRLSDERYRRALKRRRTEEIMGWVCVPVLLMIGWIGWQAWQEINPGRPSGSDTVFPTTTIRRN
jgi:predicted negative regulator of RcsB-dependent stress response